MGTGEEIGNNGQSLAGEGTHTMEHQTAGKMSSMVDELGG